MSDIEFGVVATLTGMGVTLATLYILALLIRLMNRLWPEREQTKGKK